jgi:hypothetical protein
LEIDGGGAAVTDKLKECDFWLFRELYFVLAAFADDPQNTIDRIGAGHIAIPEDLANHLDNFRRAILDNYSDLANLEVMRVATEIDAIPTVAVTEVRRLRSRFDK